MIGGTESSAILIKLAMAILVSAALLAAAVHWRLAGRFVFDSLVGGVMTALLVLAYPLPIGAPTWLVLLLWLAAGALTHVMPRLATYSLVTPPERPPATRLQFAQDVDSIEALFDFEEVS